MSNAITGSIKLVIPILLSKIKFQMVFEQNVTSSSKERTAAREEPQQGKNRRYGRTADMEELQQAREEPQQGKNRSKGRTAAREELQ